MARKLNYWLAAVCAVAIAGSAVPTGAAVVGKPCHGRVTQDEVGHGYNAVDVANDSGTHIAATHKGRVDHREVVDSNGNYISYGKYIVMTHDNSYQSYYCHMKSRGWDGQIRYRNEKIGEMGESGNATGPHLHFEIRQAGVRLHIPAIVGNWWTRNDDIKNYEGI